MAQINRPKVLTGHMPGGVFGYGVGGQVINIYDLLVDINRWGLQSYPNNAQSWQTLLAYGGGPGVVRTIVLAGENPTSDAHTMELQATFDGVMAINRSYTFPAGSPGRQQAIIYGGNVAARFDGDLGGLTLGWMPWENDVLIQTRNGSPGVLNVQSSIYFAEW